MYIKEVVCLMIKSPKFTHSKKDNNKAQGRSTHLTAIVVSLVLSIIMITIRCKQSRWSDRLEQDRGACRRCHNKNWLW